MAVLKKLRSRLFQFSAPNNAAAEAIVSPPLHQPRASFAAPREIQFDIRPLTTAQTDEVWRLDLRCFVDGEAYSRETFDYLLGAPESVSYRAVTTEGRMIGFVVGLVEAQNVGHITTLGVAPEHRRKHVARRILEKIEDGFRRRHVKMIRLEVRSTNMGAQALYQNLGYTITQRLARYYSNGGDGLMMMKSLE